MRVVHVPIEAYVQHAIAVEKRDWSPRDHQKTGAARAQWARPCRTFSTPALEVGHCPAPMDFNEEG